MAQALVSQVWASRPGSSNRFVCPVGAPRFLPGIPAASEAATATTKPLVRRHRGANRKAIQSGRWTKVWSEIRSLTSSKVKLGTFFCLESRSTAVPTIIPDLFLTWQHTGPSFP